MVKEKCLTIRQVVVDRIVLRRQLREEQLREIGNPLVTVFKALRHLAKLTFDLDHAIQDQVSEHHECVLLDDEVVGAQAHIQVVEAFVNDGGERYCQIANTNDDVRADVGIPRRFEDLEEEHVVLFAELAGYAEELGE